MATGQTLLDRMEILHPEMQLQPGETDVVKGLICANIAQDYLESVLALTPQMYGDSYGTIDTVPGAESSPFPTGVLRIDALWALNNGRPTNQIEMAGLAGGHLPNSNWPQSLAAASGGRPTTAWPNGRVIFWGPVPDAVYSYRWYGFEQQPDITVAGTIQYPDICLTPLATFACKAYRVGLDDSAVGLTSLANDLFEPVVQAMSSFRRDWPSTLTYSQVHVT